MLSSVTLENFRSFGSRQVIKLQPITALVGPNNSGKSSFISLGRFARRLASSRPNFRPALDAEGGASNLVHRPLAGSSRLLIQWSSEAGTYTTSLRSDSPEPVLESEDLTHGVLGKAWVSGDATEPAGRRVHRYRTSEGVLWGQLPFEGFLAVMHANSPKLQAFREVLQPLAESREIKLSLATLRKDAPFTQTPSLGPDGSDLAAVVSHWRSAYPERAEELDATLRTCLPELRHVLAMPAPEGNLFRLWFRQDNGELFEAKHVSDGVLLFTALVMHAIDAAPGSVVFIEEPEHSIHPRMLHDVVELLRRMVEKKGCQFVIATHSTVLLDELRDEPEAILLFRREGDGTKVTPLDEVPRLVEALQKANPGEMLASGFFHDPL